MLRVNTSLIRFWEKTFSELSPRKNSKGNRKFDADDIELLSTIHLLVKKQGYTLEGAKNALQANQKGLKKHYKTLQSLKEIRAFLGQLHDTMQQA